MSEGGMNKKQIIDEFITNLTPRRSLLVIYLANCLETANAVLEHNEPCVCDECKEFAYHMAMDDLANVFESADDEPAVKTA